MPRARCHFESAEADDPAVAGSQRDSSARHPSTSLRMLGEECPELAEGHKTDPPSLREDGAPSAGSLRGVIL